MEARVPHAWGMGSRVQSQGIVVREILKPETTSERQPGYRAILKGWGLCPEGRGDRSRVWALKSEGKDRGGPRNLACCFLAQYPLNTSQKFQPKFEVGSPKLSSAEPFLRALLMLASTPTPARPVQPLLLSSTPPRGRGREGAGEDPDTQPRAWNSRSLHPTHHSSGILGERGDLPVMTSVQARQLALSRTHPGKVWGLVLEALKGPFPALIL